MSPRNLLDPDENDLIPRDDDLDELRKSDLFPNDDPQVNPGLMDPDQNDLIPRDDLPTARRPPRPRAGEAENLVDFLERAARGDGHSCERVSITIAPGLMASHCPSGGLSVFKDGAQVHSVDALSPTDQKAINDLRERYQRSKELRP